MIKPTTVLACIVIGLAATFGLAGGKKPETTIQAGQWCGGKYYRTWAEHQCGRDFN